jgi:mRNA interferase HigB
VKILNQIAIERFVKKHPAAKPSMEFWVDFATKAKWTNGAEVVRDFTKANFKKGTWIFNVGGNAYRLTADISFTRQEVLVDKVMTHAQYDKEKL